MRRGLVALLFMAACNGGQGVDIEVHAGSTSIDAVELWLAYNVCKLPDGSGECDGIGWPNAQQRLSGEVYTLGDDEKLVRTDVIVDGVAQLHLEATPNTSSPYIIAVVGYHGGSIAGVKMLSGPDIPLSDQAHWRIQLDDVGQVTENLTQDPGEKPSRNALVWARKPSSMMRDVTGYTGCFAYQKWTGSEWETKYIVPPSDPDCDGDPPDCNPYWYDASVANARCVGDAPTIPGVCAVGSLACKSELEALGCGVQSDPMICVGSNICDRCADSLDLGACIKNEIGTLNTVPPGMPMQRCTFVINADGPCLNSSNPPGWKTQFFIPGATCAANLANETAVLRQVFAPFSGGSDMLTLNNGATVSVHAYINTGVGCQVDVTYTSMPANPALVPVVLAVFYGPTREILIPLLLDFQKPAGGSDMCPAPATPPQCVALGDWPEGQQPGDSMFQCAR